MLVSALLVALAVARAAPADDHQRGLQAFHRGDVAAAMAALRPAAAAGHPPSQALLAYIFDRADFVEEAARLYRQAADGGDADGAAGLAGLYVSGRGVAKDEKLALQHFSKAAALGHEAAAEAVAQAYLKRQLGADASVDPEGARQALLRAAGQGHLASAEALAEAYRRGSYGLVADEAQAQQWQAKATAWRQQRASAPTRPPR
jgi:TPR repeat protein